VLRLHKVCKTFTVTPRVRELLRFRRPPPVEVLRDISFEIGAGQIVGLIGPNGAGKSTLMRCVAGLVVPTSGELLVDGSAPTAGGGTQRRRIGWVSSEDRSFNLRLTGRENLAFFAELAQMDGGSRADAVADALARVGLTRQADRPFRTYSSGMRQRLSMGRALIADPVLLLLDEASTGLDPGRRESFKRLCLQLAKEQGKAILIASHDMAELEALCDTVHLLDGGRVVASGGFAAVAAAADAVFAREQAEEEACGRNGSYSGPSGSMISAKRRATRWFTSTGLRGWRCSSSCCTASPSWWATGWERAGWVCCPFLLAVSR
jgi:ABC-2 type transport system ATP-binding protein